MTPRSIDSHCRRACLAAVLVFALIGACSSLTWSQDAPPAASPPKASVPAAASQDQDGDRALQECRSELAAIRKLYAEIPVDFRGFNRQRIEELAKLIYECRGRLEKFSTHCSNVVGPACDLPFMLARLRTSLAARERIDLMQVQKLPGEEVNARMDQYHAESLVMCDRTLECVGKSAEHAELRCRTLDLRGDISFQRHDFEPALASYLEVLEGCPDYPGIGNTVVATGRCYHELRRVEPGLEFIRKAIKEHYRDSQLPLFYEVEWNLLETKGDIDGMIAWCDTVRKIFPVRQLRDKIDATESDAYQRYLGYSGFRLGYARFAKGDLSGATEAFLKHIEEMDALELQLEKGKRSLPQELKIYRQRSRDVLAAIQDRVGDPAPCDLDLDDMWVSPRRVRIGDSKGKVVALLFRGDGDRRSKGFFRNLDAYLGRNTGRNVDFAAVHFLKGSKDPLGQLERLQDEIIELGIQHAAVGMDPDPRNKQVFRCLNAMVGSATFMIFDRQGRLAWWMQDPRDMDSDFVINIIERLMAE